MKQWHCICGIFGDPDMNLEALYSSFEDMRISKDQDHRETAVIRLVPGGVTSEELCGRPGFEQMVLVLEGEMLAEIDGERRIVAKGGTLVIGAGVKYRLSNTGPETAIAFAVYAPGSSLPGGMSA